MIDLHYFPTPNGWKVSIALEELDLPYRVVACNIGRGDQFEPEFLAISPNNRMPAIVDADPAFGGEPVSVFESGAILQYLAEKTGRLLPADPRRRLQALEWMYWQMANEAHRLYRVLDERLAQREFVADEFSMADILCWPWVHMREHHGQNLEEFPQLERWYDQLLARPAFERGLAVGLDLVKDSGGMDEEARRTLFGQR